MKYLITGGAGFIGSHLAEKLINKGNQVTVVDNLSTGSLDNLGPILVNKNLTYIYKDIQKIDFWEKILSKDTYIIHLAATVGVNKVMGNALETTDNNFTTTKILLDKALKFQCKFFFASTSEVYGDSGKPSSTEKDSLLINGTHCGRTSYVLSKLLSEHYCINYFQQYSIPVIIGRFFNVIGTRQCDTYGMVAPTFVKQALANKPITIFGDGSQTRNFGDVDDVTNAIISVLETDNAYGEVFNIGGTENTTIYNFANYIKNAANSMSPIVFLPFPEERSEGRDIHHRSPCLNKIKAFTGWEPNIPWQNSVLKIINHHTAKTNISMEENADVLD